MTDGKRDTKKSAKHDAKSAKKKAHTERAFERDAIRKAQGDRARQARDHARITQIGMGRLIAKEFQLKAPQMYFRQEKGERGLSAKQRKFIAETTGVRLEWLTYGDGDMLPDGAKPQKPRAVLTVIDDGDQVPTHGPIWDLLMDGRCNPLLPEDVRWLKQHLAYGDPPTLESLELSLRMRRAFVDPSDETERAYLLAIRERRKTRMSAYYNEEDQDRPDHARARDVPVLKPPKLPQLPPGQPERRRKD